MTQLEEKFGSDLANIHFDFLSEDPVSCILCDEYFTINYNYQALLKHLMEAHRFLIGSPEEIADIRHYIKYWKKLQFSRLEDHCIIYKTNTEPDAKERSENIFLLCEKLPEDKYLRTTLAQMKLNFITHQKEEECRNKDFSRLCIYCPSIIGGGVANSFHHLTFDHGFSLGNPDNIVFGERLLNIMDSMLQRLQCLNCEKTFKNHLTLREHMRKKQHRSLNPKNKQYDKFYLLNYLKPGTPWEEAKKSILEEKETFSTKELESMEADESYDEEQLWTDWKEDSGGIPAVCLFCPYTTTKISTALFHHMNDNHHFPFENLTKDLKFYSKVKLVNFIRSQVQNSECFSCSAQFASYEALIVHMDSCNYLQLSPEHLWDNPRFLIPVLENDGLLIHLDDNDIDDEDTSSIASSLNEEIVLPEDSVAFSSILSDCKLLHELSEDVRGLSDASPLLFKCLFCPFSMNGQRGRSVCLSHMNSMHNFSYRENLEKIEGPQRAEIINYLRVMTDLGQCFVCRKSYVTKGALEEHRILEGHTDLPVDILLKDRWKKQLVNDGFLSLNNDT